MGSADLIWGAVKDSIPKVADRGDIYGAWENFFNGGGLYASATEVRTARRRDEMRPFLWGLVISLLLVPSAFAVGYYYNFRRTFRHSWGRHIVKTLLFSLDVVPPGIGPWKYDWSVRGGLPVHQVAALTAIEAAIGWLILALGSAVMVAWQLA